MFTIVDFRANYKGDVKIRKQAIILIVTLILGIMLCGAVSAAGLADSPWPKSGHDLNNTGQSQYKGPQTNTTKWNYTTNGSITFSPVIGSDGIIYFGSWDNHLYALNPNGTQKWNYTTSGWISTSPAIGSDGTIYFGSWDNNTYALDPNGTQKWNYTTKGQILSSPAIDNDGTIYFGDADGNLYALNPNGTLKWNFTTGHLIFSSPAIGSGGIIYFGCDDHNLYALNSNGTLKWNYTTGNYVSSSPAIGSDGTIYFGGEDNNTYALNSNGTLKWIYTTVSYVTSSPTIGNDGTIYIGSSDHNLYALNTDGTLKWNFTTGGGVSSPVIGSDGTIYLGSNDGNLYALNSNGTQKWNYIAGGGVGYPAIGGDGTLYFRNGNSLYAIQDKLPAVVSVDPVNNAVNVQANKVINLTFSNPIEMGSGQIELKNSIGSAIAFITSINGSTLTITPTNLLKNGKYTLTLYNGSLTDLFGNSLEFYSSSFTVDTISPMVSANQTSGISNSNINVKLSSESDAAIYYRINSGSWYNFTGSGTVLISNIGTNNLEFYAVDIAGNPSAHTTYSYIIDKTAPKLITTSPKNGATGVSRTATITLRFSENIISGVNWSKIYIKNVITGKTVAISKSISGNTLYIKMALKRYAYTWYQVYIPALAVKDRAGNSLAVGYTFRFKTGRY